MEPPARHVQEPPKVKAQHGRCKEEDSYTASLNGRLSQSPAPQTAPLHKPAACGSQEKSSGTEANLTKATKTDEKVLANTKPAMTKNTGARDSVGPSTTTVPTAEQDTERGSSSPTTTRPRKISRARVVLVFIQASLLIAQLTLVAVDWHIHRSILRLPGHPARIFRYGGLVIINFLSLILCDCCLSTDPVLSFVYLVMGSGWFYNVVGDSASLKNEVSACGPADEPCLAIWAFYHKLGWDYLALGCATL